MTALGWGWAMALVLELWLLGAHLSSI